MTQVYKASRKTVGKDGQNYWNPVGFTVFVGEYNGQPSVTLVDERTGEKYPCFPPKQRTLEPVEKFPKQANDETPF